MKVRLRNPDREVELAGGRKIHDVLGELGINPDTVLVIRERQLLTREDRVGETDVIEIRPVISGGAGILVAGKCSTTSGARATAGSVTSFSIALSRLCAWRALLAL